MSESLPQSTAEALQRAVRDLGRRVSENPERVRAVLSDGLGVAAREHRAEIDALALASEEGIPATLMDREESLVTEADLALDDQRLLDRLRERGLAPDAAAFAIGAWAMALGSASTLSSTSTPGLAATGMSFGAGAGSLSDPVDATELPPSPVADTVDAPPPEEPTHAPAATRRSSRMVVPVRRGVIAAAVAAVLAVVAGTAWVSFLGDEKEPALFVGGVSRTSTTTTTTTSTAGPSSGTASRVTTATTTKAAATKTSPKPTKTTPVAKTTSKSSSAPTRTVIPTRAPVITKTTKKPPPPPPPPPVKTLTAGNTSAAWTPLFYEEPARQCVSSVPPHAAGNVCQAKLNVVKGGNVTTWSISSATSAQGHGSVSVSGHQILYTPHHNGAFSDTVRYRLSGGGVTSNWATIAITVYCNTNLGCY